MAVIRCPNPSCKEQVDVDNRSHFCPCCGEKYECYGVNIEEILDLLRRRANFMIGWFVAFVLVCIVVAHFVLTRKELQLPLMSLEKSQLLLVGILLPVVFVGFFVLDRIAKKKFAKLRAHE